MPTFAGYIMTPKHQLEWLRTRYPEIEADEDHIPAANLLFELIRKHKMLSIFRFELVALPGPPDTDLLEDGDLNPKRMAIMFVRRTCTGDKVGWIPQREIPGVASDGRVGQYLKRWGLVTSDWVVLHKPVDDPFRSFWVLKPTTTGHNSGSNSLDHDRLRCGGGDLWTKLRWPSWSFVLLSVTLLFIPWLVLKLSKEENLALSLFGNYWGHDSSEEASTIWSRPPLPDCPVCSCE
ncbi:hypothetical protein ACGC1H_005830 [Rhizoctonia solani]|uniref:Uncharacterized protein n=1 Tax=Rhizoctonia solani TaxID=456999 RepID=A0A8H3CCS1_9AGAM|nr:unnamed protein product [Rhizoctonia solani]